jgi:hypothetical protein
MMFSPVSVHQELLGKQKPRTHQGGGFQSSPRRFYSVSFLTTHQRKLSFPLKGTLALHLPGCQTRLRVVPDVGSNRIDIASHLQQNYVL